MALGRVPGPFLFSVTQPRFTRYFEKYSYVYNKISKKNSIGKNDLLTGEQNFSIFGCISILNVG